MNHALQEAMAQAGETAESLAAQTGVDPKTAARWISPGRVPQPRRRVALASILGRDVGDLWPDVLRRREPAWFRRWADVLQGAAALRWFELAWVPGLLQTEAYARATLALATLDPAEVDELVTARVQRQSILHRAQPPLVVAVIDEAALRRRAGRDGSIMREQCEHLAACAELPAVQVHIVPADTPIYVGMGGPFILAEMPDGTRVAHQDGPARAHITEDATEIASLERRWSRIVGEALPRAQSLDLIRKAVAAWT
ncbi:helix-turn-helix transcriptional regulator [Micromonospora sp. HUAS LYJ1]|uniref:helix-turn-helix domain-containing protein n=1 Tax=Micromonospora sp. HUAS LYJ1 TaxID=3061626 RepID=UPI002671FED3|nr:helix-turn-helix transcriptional regulator [Micromonospora sp. HUAS LYJ1]WKU07162.1 helix-turn-helix transcriptional regulator [Micromonospora sp. HUAS LYJ1]